jgi:tetratricopeptide (TPR) repeat protein
VEPSLANAGVEMKHLDIPVHHYGRFDTDKLLKKGKEYFLLGKQKLEEMKGDFRALKELAIQACELGEFEAGVDLWRVVIERDPNDAMAFLNLSYAYLKLERYEEAHQASRRAAELNPTMKEAALNYAGCEYIVGDVKKTISILEKLLQEQPDYPPAIALIAAAYYVSGLKEEGLKLLEKLRKMGFNCTEFFNDQYRGVISQGRVDQAVLLLEAAVESGNINQDTNRLITEYQKKRGDAVKDGPVIFGTVSSR